MAQITDFSTNVAKVRLLISDLDDQQQVFGDPALTAFIAMALDNNLKRAAALALRTMAANEVLVQKRIKILDLSTDGPAESAELRQLAATLDQQADNEEIDGVIDWAEMIQTGAQYDEWNYKNALRNG